MYIICTRCNHSDSIVDRYLIAGFGRVLDLDNVISSDSFSTTVLPKSKPTTRTRIHFSHADTLQQTLALSISSQTQK